MKQLLSVILFSISLFLCIALPGGTKEEKTEEIPVAKSVCLLKGKKGSGSGFFAEIDHRNVVITNNHVLLEMRDVRILDVNGNEYTCDEAYVSPKLDLAVIPVQRNNTHAMPNLRFQRSPDMLQLNAPVTAYGDSLGDGVIAASKGRFLGIGPGIIEVDAGFVPGNSGGPVLDDKSRLVIGVATYSMIRTQPKATEIGSRFFSSPFTPSIRRFATRTDRIDLSQFEKVNREKIRKDQDAWEIYAKLYEQVVFLMESRSESAVSSIKRLLLESSYRDMRFPGQWETTYLRNDCIRKANMLNAVWNCLFRKDPAKMIDDDETSLKITKLWKENISRTKVVTEPPLYAKCLVCKGETTVVLPVRQWPGNRKIPHTAQVVRCYHCSGKGKYLVPVTLKHALPAKEFQDGLSDLIQPETHPFAGLKTGGRYNLEKTEYESYMKDGTTKCFNLFKVIRIYGNPHFHNAAETRLWFIGELLLRTDIFFPAEDYESMLQTENRIKTTLPGLQQAVFSTVPAQRFSDRNRLKRDERSRLTEERLNYNGRQRMTELKSLAAEDPFQVYFFPKRNSPPGIRFPVYCRITLQHRYFDHLSSLMQ